MLPANSSLSLFTGVGHESQGNLSLPSWALCPLPSTGRFPSKSHPQHIVLASAYQGIWINTSHGPKSSVWGRDNTHKGYLCQQILLTWIITEFCFPLDVFFFLLYAYNTATWPFIALRTFGNFKFICVDWLMVLSLCLYRSLCQAPRRQGPCVLCNSAFQYRVPDSYHNADHAVGTPEYSLSEWLTLFRNTHSTAKFTKCTSKRTLLMGHYYDTSRAPGDWF